MDEAAAATVVVVVVVMLTLTFRQRNANCCVQALVASLMLPSGDSLRKVHVMVMMVMMVKMVKKCLRHADAQRAGRLEREPAG